MEANRWLHLADAPIRLTGTPAVPTELGPVTHPDAVLCRTNVGAMAQGMTLMAVGYRVALAGGGDSLQALALAARDLKEGRRTHHPEFILFPCWGDLQAYAAHDPAGRDLQPLVNLVDAHGTDAILTAVAQLVPEPHALVTVTTAHKAKGREWPRVLIADDFSRPNDTANDQPDTTPSSCASPAAPWQPRCRSTSVPGTCGCGTTHDRDVNAAKNLLAAGRAVTAAELV